MMIDELRSRLDNIDGQLMNLLESRLDISRRIAEYKRMNKIPICDKARERAVLKSRINMLKNNDYESCGRIMAQTLIKLSKMEQKRRTTYTLSECQARASRRRLNHWERCCQGKRWTPTRRRCEFQAWI